MLGRAYFVFMLHNDESYVFCDKRSFNNNNTERERDGREKEEDYREHNQYNRESSLLVRSQRASIEHNQPIRRGNWTTYFC